MATTACRRCSTSTATRSTAATRDMVIAVRELDQAGLPDGQRNWANEHTVYTHGYGVIAAYGNQRDADDKPVPTTTASRCGPSRTCRRGRADRHVPGRLPAADLLRRERAPTTPSSARPPGGRDVELDLPEGSGGHAGPATRTTATAGVPVGGLFNKLLYAIKFSEPNIVLSSRVNENSQDPLRPRPARAGAEGRALADRRRRRLPGGRRRPGEVDPRRLHDDRPLPERREGLAAVHDRRTR